MDMIIRFAEADEFNAVRDFYYEVIDGMEGSEYRPMWQKGVYPYEDDLKHACENGEAVLAVRGESIVAAMMVNSRAGDGYATAPWRVAAELSEVLVIHALGVMPELSGQGIGKAMVRKAYEIAAEKGLKAIRLDVLRENLPAVRLYESTGFTFIKRVKLFYEDTGLCDFDLYEREIQKV